MVPPMFRMLASKERKALKDAVAKAEAAGYGAMDIRKLKASQLLVLTGRSWLVVPDGHWPKKPKDDAAYDFLGDGLLVCSERFADKALPILMAQWKANKPPDVPTQFYPAPLVDMSVS